MRRILGLILMLCASRVPALEMLSPDDGSDFAKPVEASAMLGNDFKGAKLVGWLVSEDTSTKQANVLGAPWRIVPKIAVYDVESGKTTVLAEHPQVEKLNLGRPYWSRDGKQILYVYQGKCFMINADGSGQKEIVPGATKGGAFCSEAWFQNDPADGSPCIGFQTWENPSGVEYGINLYHPETDKVRKVADGHHWATINLSFDGTHRGTGFISNGKDPVPALFYGEWDKGCNHSMSPDNTYRHMWLQWYHRAFAIFDPFGRRVWRMQVNGNGYEMIRWSWHPDFCTADTGYTDNGQGKNGIVIIKISTHEQAQLKVQLGFPHLWLPSVPKLSLKKTGPVDNLKLTQLAPYKEKLANAICYTPIVEELKKSTAAEAKQVLVALEQKGKKDFELAKRVKDPLDYVPAVREIATRYAGQPLGDEARAFLESEQTKKEIAAALKWVEIATRTLWSPEFEYNFKRQKYTDPVAAERYKGGFARLSDQIKEFKAAFAGTYSEKVLDEVARRCELPGAVVVKKEQVEVVARISKVARVPQFHEIAPYKDALSSIQYDVQKVVAGECKDKKLLVVHQVMTNKVHTPAAAYKVGAVHRLKLERFDLHPELDKIFRLPGADDPEMIPWWPVEPVQTGNATAPAKTGAGK